MAIESPISLNMEYFSDTLTGRAVSLGNLYVGIQDLDPSIEANRKTVTVIQEDGTRVPILPAIQPLSIINGRVQYNGSPVAMVADDVCSIKVTDRLGNQLYYAPQTNSYPLAVDLASTDPGKGASLVGIEDAEGIYDSTTVEGALAETRKGYTNKADAITHQPVNGVIRWIGGTDGGWHKEITGAAPGTYSDNGVAYCGTQFIPTGGDGSKAWVRVDISKVTPDMFGAIADSGTTDNARAFQLWADYLNTNKGNGWVVKQSDYYAITEPFMLLSDVTIDFNGQLIKNTASSGSNFWKNTVCFLGTYFGATNHHFADDDKDPLTLETVDPVYQQYFLRDPYDCDDISANDNTVTLQTAGDVNDFSVGDVVMIRDPNHTQGDNMVSVSGITRSGATATATTAAAHGYSASDYVLVIGANELDYNGYYVIDSTPTTTTFTYTVDNSPTTPATGTITCDTCSIPYSTKEHLNEVLSIAGDILTLKYPVKDDYSTSVGAGQNGGATGPVALYRESGTLVNTNIPTAQTTDQAGAGICTLAKRSKIRNANFESTVDTFGQVFHIACYECELENITVTGPTGWGINPCAYTTFNNIKSYTRDTNFEMAYCHNDVTIDGILISRIGSNTSQSNLGFTETGQDVRVTNFNVNSYTGGDGGISAMNSSTRRVHFENGTVGGSDGAGITFTGDAKAKGCAAKNITILNHDTDGVQVNSNDIEIDNLTISPTVSTQEAIQLSQYVTTGKITNNVCGISGSRTAGDIIYLPQGRKSGIQIRNNQTFNTYEHEVDNTEIEHTGTTSLTTIKTHTFTQNTTPQKDWKVRIVCSGRITPASTNGIKTIAVTFNGTNIGQLDLEATDTGHWQFIIEISKETNTSAFAQVLCTAESVGDDDNKYTTISDNWSSTDLDIDIDVTLANVSDIVRLKGWEVEYIGAEYNTVT